MKKITRISRQDPRCLGPHLNPASSKYKVTPPRQFSRPLSYSAEMLYGGYEGYGMETTEELQRVEPLLCNDSEMGGYARVVSGQRLGKHVPAGTDMNATIEKLCSLRGPCRDVISKGRY
jgi:hypothetical protein